MEIGLPALDNYLNTDVQPATDAEVKVLLAAFLDCG